MRLHMNAFFNPGNVEAVYTTLRNAVLGMSEAISAEGSDTAGWRSVDATTTAHDLINTVVKDVRPFSRRL